jgi:hypothetical protein
LRQKARIQRPCDKNRQSTLHRNLASVRSKKKSSS